MNAGPPTAERASRGEEVANALTHGLGVVLALAGLGVLVVSAGRHAAAHAVVGCAVFGATLVLLYARVPSRSGPWR
jgi:hemolysin III